MVYNGYNTVYTGYENAVNQDKTRQVYLYNRETIVHELAILWYQLIQEIKNTETRYLFDYCFYDNIV